VDNGKAGTGKDRAMQVGKITAEIKKRSYPSNDGDHQRGHGTKSKEPWSWLTWLPAPRSPKAASEKKKQGAKKKKKG